MPKPFDRRSRYAAVHTVHLEEDATLADGSSQNSRCHLVVQIAVGLVQLILALTLMYFGLMSFKPGFWSTFPTSLEKYWLIRSNPDSPPSSTYDPPSTRPEANYIHSRRLFTKPFPVFQPTPPPVFSHSRTLVSPPIPSIPDPDAQSAKFDPTEKLVHCTAGKFNVANCLNRRFKTGKPSNDVIDAGVLVTQWDLLHDYDAPWNRGDYFVGTIKNAEMAPRLGSYE